MSVVYVKNDQGKYIPVSFTQIATKDWEDKIIFVRIGTDKLPADKEEIEQAVDAINNANVLDSLENTSFLITGHNVSFEVLGTINDIGDKYVAVSITGSDDLSSLGDLQKEARRQLRGLTKKVVILPTPLTVSEYKEVMEIKRRCDIRRDRRGS